MEMNVGKEIERKYLVEPAAWKPQDAGMHFKQGYLNSQKERVVRVRIEGDRAKLTIKGMTTGVTRAEFEYPHPGRGRRDAAGQPLRAAADRQAPPQGDPSAARPGRSTCSTATNEGLVVAEIELASEDEKIELPAWVVMEVSSDPRYFNSNLLKQPFSTWK